MMLLHHGSMQHAGQQAQLRPQADGLVHYQHRVQTNPSVVTDSVQTGAYRSAFAEPSQDSEDPMWSPAADEGS